MKKTYNKPQIIVEAFTMDLPIASNCNVAKDVLAALKDIGCFIEGPNCSTTILPNGGVDSDGDGKADGGFDFVCYHSNVQYAFNS